jgi:Fic family protein
LSLYHIVSQSLKKSEIYYLAKSIRVNDKVIKIRIKLGNTKPTPKEEQFLVSTPNLTLEKKVLDKRIELCLEAYKPKYITPEDIKRLEKTNYWSHFFNLFLTKSEIDYFNETSRIEYIHGTTAIEGNTFSLQQVDDLLNREIIPTSKSLREINEVQNYLAVNEYLKDNTSKVTLSLIRNLHELIMNNIDSESAGRFRRIDTIGIRGVEIAVTPSLLIKSELESIVDEYYGNIQSGGHPFEEAILFHYRFEMIHPFTDGNGRVGREVLNFMLEKTRFPRLVIKAASREKYINALQDGNNGKYEDMLSSFIELLEDQRAETFKKILDGEIRL